MTDVTRWCHGCRSDKPSTDFSPASRRCRECHNTGARRRRAIDYEAELERQGGGCAICKKPPSGYKGKLVHDHDPATGNFRGLLCQPCNLMLGNAQEDPAILAAGAEYLGKPGRPINVDPPARRTKPVMEQFPVHVSYREPIPPPPPRVIPSPGMGLAMQPGRRGKRW